MQQHGDSGGAVAAVLGGGRAAPGVEDFGADIGQLATGDGDGAGGVVEAAAAVVAQIVPAALRAVGDLQAARRRGGVDGLHVVVAPVVVDDADAGAVRHLNKFGGRAEGRLPGTAADVLGEGQDAARVVHRADGIVTRVQRPATVVEGAAARAEGERAGQDGVAEMDGRALVERRGGSEGDGACGGSGENLRLPGGGKVGQRRFHLRCRHQFFHQGRHADFERLRFRVRHQRLDSVILRAVGNVGFPDFARRLRLARLRIIYPGKVGGERGRGLHLHHRFHKLLPFRCGKGALFRGDADDLDVLLHLWITARLLPQTVHIANQRQRLAGALIGLDDARALRLRREQGHARFNRRHRVGGNALDDVAAHLAIAYTAIE